ncbi:hypothetical protein NDU88_001807 [Pleurodeles waltl]|uniref:Uncharacterized protein n=1 Tax=Pleurodeles waltl TaxID=8319 RepID=A0AAV7T0R7_PLEWA|nr:hypothetical protein NDU88_001807 [Pleurodeles waltl]
MRDDHYYTKLDLTASLVHAERLTVAHSACDVGLPTSLQDSTVTSIPEKVTRTVYPERSGIQDTGLNTSKKESRGIDLVALPTLEIDTLRSLWRERNIFPGNTASKEDLEKTCKALVKSRTAQVQLEEKITATNSGEEVDDGDFVETEEDSERGVPTIR